MNTKLQIEIGKIKNGRTRCGYCFESPKPAQFWSCKACGAIQHTECFQFTGSCFSLGCENKTGTERPQLTTVDFDLAEGRLASLIQIVELTQLGAIALLTGLTILIAIVVAVATTIDDALSGQRFMDFAEGLISLIQIAAFATLSYSLIRCSMGQFRTVIALNRLRRQQYRSIKKTHTNFLSNLSARNERGDGLRRLKSLYLMLRSFVGLIIYFLSSFLSFLFFIALVLEARSTIWPMTIVGGLVFTGVSYFLSRASYKDLMQTLQCLEPISSNSHGSPMEDVSPERRL